MRIAAPMAADTRYSVAALWRHPVKSMRGFEVAEASFTDLGMEGDRIYALRDLARGRLANVRQDPSLLGVEVSVDNGVVWAAIDGRTVRLDDPAANEAFSGMLGTPIEVQALRPPNDTEFYRRRPDPSVTDPLAHLREVLGRTPDEPLPDFSKFGPSVAEYETPPGSFVDCFPVLLLTTSALRSLQAALPSSVIDVRRFRPTVVVDTGDESGHPEFDWVGRRMQLGAVVLEVANDCPRCVAITRRVDDSIPDDRAILRHVVRDLGQAVGVYCNVLAPGSVRVGDSVGFTD